MGRDISVNGFEKIDIPLNGGDKGINGINRRSFSASRGSTFTVCEPFTKSTDLFRTKITNERTTNGSGR